MNRMGAAFAVGTLILFGTSKGKATTRTTQSTPTTKPTTKPSSTKPSSTSSKRKGTEGEAIGRMAAAVATFDPGAMRAEAAKLRRDGWDDYADDLEHSANIREEELKAEHSLPQLPSGGGSAPSSSPAHSAGQPTHPAAKPAAKPAPKPAPKPSPMHPPGTETVPQTVPQTLPPAPRTLREGMVGEDVRGWQHTLRLDGFDVIGEDSIFGPATTQATKEWQTDHGIEADGIVGNATRAAVGGRVKLGARTLKLGSYGPAVKAWKGILVSSGYHIPITGTFDEGTQQATQAWQFERDLTPDGIVGPKTLAKVGTDPVIASTPANPVTPAKAPYPVTAWRTLRMTSPPMKGEDVGAWQTVLVHSGYAIKIDNVFGDATRAATVKWQRAHGLTADGIVGAGTRGAINPNDLVSGDLQPALSAASPLPGVLPYMVPDEVVPPDRALAARLALHISQHAPGTEDRELVAQYQRERGLNATGNYGAATAASLISFGIVPPRPFFWPRKERQQVRERYVAALLTQARRDDQRRDEWEQAANV
jgi:peptidoglycan hydrolase-like protein with peptidoglycan-binding domain